MNQPAIGQKLDEILRRCEKLEKGLQSLEKRDAEVLSGQIQEPVKSKSTKGAGKSEVKEFWKSLSNSDRIQAILAALTLLALYFNALNYRTAENTYEAASRPFVGVDGSSVVFLKRALTSGFVNSTPGPTQDSNAMGVAVNIKNFGSATAENLRPEFTLRINGVPVHAAELPEMPPDYLFQGQITQFRVNVEGEDYQNMIASRGELAFQVTLNYERSSHPYHYCERQRFIVQSNTFVPAAGTCDSKWPGES